MEVNLEEFISKLYIRSIKNEAMILTLKTMLISYVSIQNKKQGDALEAVFEKTVKEMLELIVLNSPFHDEYLQGLSETAVQDLKRQLGL